MQPKRPRLRPQSSRPPGDVARAELTAARQAGPIDYREAQAAAGEAGRWLAEIVREISRAGVR